jgi:hypothetical protein
MTTKIPRLIPVLMLLVASAVSMRAEDDPIAAAKAMAQKARETAAGIQEADSAARVLAPGQLSKSDLDSCGPRNEIIGDVCIALWGDVTRIIVPGLRAEMKLPYGVKVNDAQTINAYTAALIMEDLKNLAATLESPDGKVIAQSKSSQRVDLVVAGLMKNLQADYTPRISSCGPTDQECKKKIYYLAFTGSPDSGKFTWACTVATVKDSIRSKCDRSTREKDFVPSKKDPMSSMKY